MSFSKEIIKSLAEEALLPQEEYMFVGKKKKQLSIGLPCETTLKEHRIPLTPEAVKVLVSNGHKVYVETNAGIRINFQDKDYSEAGASIIYDPKEVFKKDMVLKVTPPSKEEISWMNPGSTLMSALQYSQDLKVSIVELMKKKITAIAWDLIKDNEGIFPGIRAMSEIAGNASILLASEILSHHENGQGIMMGGISGVPPTEVVILGAGTVGEFATRASLGLGASVKIFDNSIYRLRRIQNDLGQRIYTSIIQPSELLKALKTADVVIGALRPVNGRTPVVVTSEMVSQMKFGSVIIDVSIDRGGCFETSETTSHDKPTFQKYGVIHYGVPNIASRFAKTASMALSNIFQPILLTMGEAGGCENMIKINSGFRHSVYIFQGALTNEIIGSVFDLPYKNIDLLIATL
jgi:alanine dehydrogenase